MRDELEDGAECAAECGVAEPYGEAGIDDVSLNVPVEREDAEGASDVGGLEPLGHGFGFGQRGDYSCGGGGIVGRGLAGEGGVGVPHADGEVKGGVVVEVRPLVVAEVGAAAGVDEGGEGGLLKGIDHRRGVLALGGEEEVVEGIEGGGVVEEGELGGLAGRGLGTGEVLAGVELDAASGGGELGVVEAGGADDAFHLVRRAGDDGDAGDVAFGLVAGEAGGERGVGAGGGGGDDELATPFADEDDDGDIGADWGVADFEGAVGGSGGAGQGDSGRLGAEGGAGKAGLQGGDGRGGDVDEDVGEWVKAVGGVDGAGDGGVAGLGSSGGGGGAGEEGGCEESEGEKEAHAGPAGQYIGRIGGWRT